MTERDRRSSIGIEDKIDGARKELATEILLPKPMSSSLKLSSTEAVSSSRATGGATEGATELVGDSARDEKLEYITKLSIIGKGRASGFLGGTL